MVMEFIAGSDLGILLKQNGKPFPVADAGLKLATGTRIGERRVFVDAVVKDAGILIKDMLGPIPMVDIKIDDADPALVLGLGQLPDALDRLAVRARGRHGHQHAVLARCR